MVMLSVEQLRAIPKVELHCHLEGAIRFSTIRELAKLETQGEAAAVDQLVRQRFCIVQPVTDLSTCLSCFWGIQALLSTDDIIERVAFEACEDAHANGVVLLELRYSPTYISISHDVDHSHLTLESIHAAVCRGLDRARKQFPRLGVVLIGIIDRCLSVKDAEAAINFIIQHKDTFCAVDIANDEKLSCKPFQHLFERARSAGLKVTAHAGESGGPENVREVIDLLGASRIGHGIRIIEDESTIEYVKQRGILLEISPSSNVLTSSVSSLANHPIRRLMEKGVKVSINTDDPGLFCVDLTHEYTILQDAHNFTLDEFMKCNLDALEASFADEQTKSMARHQLQNWRGFE